MTHHSDSLVAVQSPVTVDVKGVHTAGLVWVDGVVVVTVRVVLSVVDQDVMAMPVDGCKQDEHHMDANSAVYSTVCWDR